MSRLLRGVTAQLLMLIVLPLTLVLAVISFGSIAVHQQAMRRMVGERDLRAVTATAGSMATTIQGKIDALQALTEEALKDPAAVAMSHVAMREFPGGVALYSSDGALLANTPEAQTWAGNLATTPDAPLNASGATSMAVQDNGFLIRSQSRDRRVTAAGLLLFSAFQIGKLVDPNGTDQNIMAVLFGPDGRVLSHTRPDQDDASVLAHAGVAEALRGQSGVLYQQDSSSGQEHVISYAPVVVDHAATGLGVMIEEPWDTVVDPLMQYSLAVPLITLPVLLLAMLAVVFGLRRIVQPLQQLERQARDVGAGDFSALDEDVHGIDEIKQLQGTLARMAAQIQADQQRLRHYAHSVTDAQEAERKRLARELHDDTIQNLIVLSQRVQAMRMATGRGNPPDTAKLEELRTVILQMIEDVRRFSRALRPIYLEDAGLVAALERLVCETNEALQRDRVAAAASGVTVTFNTNGQVPRLKPDVELAVYRIAQEALANALRHAGALHIAATLDGLDGDVIRLSVQDDGRGFTVPSPMTDARSWPSDSATGGFGLTDIRERAALIGAQVELVTAPGKGTGVSCWL